LAYKSFIETVYDFWLVDTKKSFLALQHKMLCCCGNGANPHFRAEMGIGPIFQALENRSGAPIYRDMNHFIPSFTGAKP